MLVSVAYDINNYSVKMSKRKKTKRKKSSQTKYKYSSLYIMH